MLNSAMAGSETDAQDSSLVSCPPLGSDFRTPFSRSNREKIFINFGAPAQCNGTVTSWYYCSYNVYPDDECDGQVNYEAKFLIYRQTVSSTYIPVPESTKLVTLSLMCPRDGGFQCHTETLSQSQQFTIQENDIVAACLLSRPIRIIGEEHSGHSLHVYQYDATNYEDCTSSQLATIDVQNSAFTQRNGEYRLHLYAETSSKSVVNN